MYLTVDGGASELLEVASRGLAVVSSVADDDEASAQVVADPPQLTSNSPGVSAVSDGKYPIIASPSMSPGQ